MHKCVVSDVYCVHVRGAGACVRACVCMRVCLYFRTLLAAFDDLQVLVVGSRGRFLGCSGSWSGSSRSFRFSITSVHSRTWSVRKRVAAPPSATSTKEVSATWRSPSLSIGTYKIYVFILHSKYSLDVRTSPARSSSYHMSNFSPLRETSGNSCTSSA